MPDATGTVNPLPLRPTRAASPHDRRRSTPARSGLALALLAITQFVIVLDASIVNVALPSIGARARLLARTTSSWVVNAYTLTFGGFLLLGGRLADLLGRRRLFMVGLILFSARLARSAASRRATSG